jgi:hypothetical protein
MTSVSHGTFTRENLYSMVWRRQDGAGFIHVVRVFHTYIRTGD